MNDYQDRAAETAIYPGKGTTLGLLYVALGLGEAGEVQGKVKKVLRDDGGVLTEAVRIKVAQELGDVLWYASQVSQEIEIPLEVIAQMNLDKLADRQERGVLTGSGDNR